MPTLADRLIHDIRQGGPITVAAFMERALYDPTYGYYARGRRSGVGGDFFTSVDTGPAFGHLLARQVARIWRALDRPGRFDLVEAGAGNGQLMRDLLDALATEAPDVYEAARASLVERGAGARHEHAERLEPHRGRVNRSTDALPTHIEGVLLANELLDAMPVHRVVAASDGLREVYVAVEHDRLTTTLGPLSTPEIDRYFALVAVTPAPGIVADVGLAALAWVREAARALSSGYLLLVDYGAEADHLFAGPHRAGTLRAYSRHLVDPPWPSAQPAAPAWLERPGEQDLTAHVDFTAIRRGAQLEGLAWLGSLPQGRWLIGLGLDDLLRRATGDSISHVRDRLRLRSLVMPGGPASSHHALVMARGRDLGPGIP